MQSVVNLKISSLTVCVSKYKHSFMINSQIWYVYVYKCVSVCVTGPSLSSRPVGACRGCKSACSTDKLFVIGWDCVRVKLSSVTLVRFAHLTDLRIRKVDAFLKRRTHQNLVASDPICGYSWAHFWETEFSFRDTFNFTVHHFWVNTIV